MTEWDRRAGLGGNTPIWFACFFFALLLFAFAAAEYLYVTDYEAAGGKHPPIADKQVHQLRRSPFAKVAEWGYPRIGKWGCVAVFAAPGLALFGTAVWLKRRNQRRG
jgi:hypothetical protein